MALQMSYADEWGHANPASYWYLVGFECWATTGRGSATLYGYRDLAACLAGLTPVGQRQVSCEGAEFAALLGSVAAGQQTIIQACYALAAADPFFAGALPV